MKKLIIGVLAIFPAIVFGQIQLVPKYTNPDSSLLFIGLENTFTIVGLNDTKGLSVSSSLNSKCLFIDDVLTVKPLATGYDTLKVYKNKKQLFNTVYKVEFLANPIPQLASTYETLLTVSRIVASPYLTVKIPKTTNLGPFRIVMFECSLSQKKMGQLKEVFTTEGNKLSEQMISAIKKLSAGDEILFSNIIAVGPNSTTRKLPNFKVTIK